MEEGISRENLQVSVARQSSLRLSGSLKTTLSGRSTPRNSPTFRRLHSSRTPRREARGFGGTSKWFRSSRLVYWLLLITLWAYLGFYVQSRWAHGDNKEDVFGFGSKLSDRDSDLSQDQQKDLIADYNSLTVKNENNLQHGNKTDVVLANSRGVSPGKILSPRRRSKKLQRNTHSRARAKQKATVKGESMEEQDIPRQNSSYGFLVGPFGSTEDKILEWSPEKRSGTCDREGDFARLVWSRKFVLIFHELSMTGAPLSMMELATELLSCGATVSAVVLSRKGGLMTELGRRRIKVLEDRAELSIKVSMKADLIIAGSAVCASWIEQYIAKSRTGSSQIAWWIMENRKEYFDRSKHVLNRAKTLIFLSESHSKQWLTWLEEENIKLYFQPSIVPLSVSDELAFVAGIASSLNSPSFSIEKMMERKNLLRVAVRKEMGLSDNDMLVISLGSINPAKGQLLLLDSVRLVIDGSSHNDSGIANRNNRQERAKHHSRALLYNLGHTIASSSGLHLLDESLPNTVTSFSRHHTVNSGRNYSRKVLSDNGRALEPSLKVLVGSVGSKSNKIDYVKGLLRYLSQHSNLSKSVLWTPASTHVASLYSAADAYVMNSQGVGETFGRVTIEAMAFGLPVLGTDAGGTKEIVDHNLTGLLHPVGRPGSRVLAENIRFLLKNPAARRQMGMRGRKKVEEMYLKRHMYEKLAEVLFKCMRIK